MKPFRPYTCWFADGVQGLRKDWGTERRGKVCSSWRALRTAIFQEVAMAWCWAARR